MGAEEIAIKKSSKESNQQVKREMDGDQADGDEADEQERRGKGKGRGE